MFGAEDAPDKDSLEALLELLAEIMVEYLGHGGSDDREQG